MAQSDPRSRLVLRATVSPSEDPAKVKAALENVVGGAAEATVGKGSVELSTDDPGALRHIRDQLRDRHVRSAARRQLLSSMDRKSASLLLNRQAAAAGAVAVCGSPEESPLGPIFLKVRAERVSGVVDWLTAYSPG